VALTFEVNGSDRRANFRVGGTLVVDKHFGVEVTTATLADRDTPGASAITAAMGQSVYVEDASGLLAGGEVEEIDRTTVYAESGTPVLTETFVTAKGYEAIPGRIVIGRLTIPSQDVLVTVDDLHTAYLAPKGITNIGATSGGPTLPALEFDHQPLDAIFNQLTTLSGYPWRINGDLEFAFLAPGDLTGPAFDESNVEEVRVRQSRVLRANRLFLRTGGTGTVTHSEGRTLNGTQTTFLLNVEPLEAPTVVTENGTDLAIGGGTWTYDSDLKAIVRSSGGTNGHVISVSYPVEFPAWMRVWDSSVQAADGTWVTASLVDAIVEASEQTDLEQAKNWGDAELARRFSQPKVVTFRTRVKGVYPLLQCNLSFPDDGISGDYLIQSVRATAFDDDNVVYSVTAVEGDTLRRNWFDFFKGSASSASGGISVAGTSGSSGGSGASVAPIRIPLGGDNYYSDNPTTWTDAPNAVPVNLGGPGLAGTWTLRAFRRCHETTSPATTIEVRLWDATNSVTLATVTGTSSTSFVGGTASFSMPLTPGLCLLQYRMVSAGTPCEGVVGQCTLERD
jgi:hypothetical protein